LPDYASSTGLVAEDRKKLDDSRSDIEEALGDIISFARGASAAAVAGYFCASVFGFCSSFRFVAHPHSSARAELSCGSLGGSSGTLVASRRA
jgi:hypothetical protein